MSPNAPNSPVTDRIPMDDKVDPLAEPYPMLPLWRRVDRQFWWNEWLSKPFVDAGVCHQPYPFRSLQSHSFALRSATLLRTPYHARSLPNLALSHRARARAA